MSNPHIMTEEDLFQDTGFSSRVKLQRWLDERHIPYHTGRGGRICGVTVQSYRAANDDEDPDLVFADGA
ncbi:DUF4224 domain-containing protein [Alloalcanivorax xenomutans]